MSDEVSLLNVRSSTCQNAPEYCARCKKCFTEHESLCPHFEKAEPIGKAILGMDLIVLVHPVYVVPSPGYVKSLMGHLGVNWLVHTGRSLPCFIRLPLSSPEASMLPTGAHKGMQKPASTGWVCR